MYRVNCKKRGSQKGKGLFARDLFDDVVDHSGHRHMHQNISKVPSPRNRPEQGVVDCEKRAEQWSIVRIDGEDDFAACKSPHARYKRERDIAQFSYEGAVNNLLKIVGGKLIPETVS